MIALAEQRGFNFDAPPPPPTEAAEKLPVLKRSKNRKHKQFDLLAPPDPNDPRTWIDRPWSLFDGRELNGEEIRFRAISESIHAEYEADRPRTRGDCLEGGINAQRPCPWVSCRHSLFLDVNEDGAIKQNWSNLEVWDERIPHTCSLDVADAQAAKGPKAQPRDFVAIGRLMNLTGTGAKKIIARAEANMRAEAEEHELEPSYDDGAYDSDSLMPAPAGNLRGFYDAAKAAHEPDPIHRQLQGKKDKAP